MAITEENRHRLYQRLEEVLGPDQAATLMEHLPPVGWADVATKRDLDGVEERLGLRIDASADRLRAEFHRDQRNLVLTLTAANTTLVGLAFAAARLI